MLQCVHFFCMRPTWWMLELILTFLLFSTWTYSVWWIQWSIKQLGCLSFVEQGWWMVSEQSIQPQFSNFLLVLMQPLDIDVYLFSGLNLIGGNRLVLYDPDWNPGEDFEWINVWMFILWLNSRSNTNAIFYHGTQPWTNRQQPVAGEMVKRNDASLTDSW